MTMSGPAQAQVRLPALGESASQDLSVGNERRLGDQIMREARRDPEYLDDPVLLEYIESIWQPLVAAARQIGQIDADTDRAFAWEAFLVRDRSVNAFALPGGFVGMHLGLIAITTTPDQLASVLAHELSHVTQRHIARSIAPQQQASMVALASLLLGILAAARANNPDVANAAIMGGQGAAIQSQLNFSRDMEREADRIGYGLLGTAGFASAGMAAMFDKMEIATRLNDNGGFPYLRTHPLTVDRISEARNRTLLGDSRPSVPTLLHAVMQVRARVLMDDSTQALLRQAGTTASPALVDRVAALYGGALAASLLKDHARAERQVAMALQLASTASPRDPRAERELRLLQAQVLIAAGDAAGALLALDLLAGAEGGRPVMVLRAQAALALPRATPDAGVTAQAALRASADSLQVWVAENPQDPIAWEALAGIHNALGYPLRSLRAGAEARYAVGDLNGAIDRLRGAQAQSRNVASGQDFIEASVIDARLRQISSQRRKLAAELRGDGRGDGQDGERGSRPEPGTADPRP
jgi:predicted Zn-dependent protease